MKKLFGKKGQVGIEVLLLTAVIIMICISIFGYYIGIMDTTTAMEMIEVETLRQLDAKPGQYFIKAIDYKLDDSSPPIRAYFCIELEPGPAGLDTSGIQAVVEGATGFAAGSTSISENTPADCE